MIKLGCLLLLLSFCRIPTFAQNIYGSSSIGIDPSTNTGTADCETDFDDEADDGYYAAGVGCSVSDSNGNTVAQQTYQDDGDTGGYAAVTLTFSATPGLTYTVTGLHTAKLTVPNDNPDDPRTITYYDEYNLFHYIESPEVSGSNYYDWFGPGPEQEERTQLLHYPATTDSLHYPKATISINFTGQKSAGDQLSFLNDPADCSQSLGLQNCFAKDSWLWSLEASYTVSDDASKWSVTQTASTIRDTGNDYDSNHNLRSFDVTHGGGSDGPGSAFLQSQSGTTTGYWIDSPGILAAGIAPDGGVTSNEDWVQSYSVQVCSTQMSGACASVSWHVHLIVTNGVLSSSSSAGYGTY